MRIKSIELFTFNITFEKKNFKVYTIETYRD